MKKSEWFRDKFFMVVEIVRDCSCSPFCVSGFCHVINDNNDCNYDDDLISSDCFFSVDPVNMFRVFHSLNWIISMNILWFRLIGNYH